MITLPLKLQQLCNRLILDGLRLVVVGGYVRDFFLQIESKDIDIEVYGTSSLEELKRALSNFTNVNEVGKSFGVLKVVIDSFEVDFTLARVEKKVSSGHCGFSVTYDSNISFKEASARRDFTINAIGYDIKEKKILDPYGGIDDLKKRTLSFVNEKSFIEDPLRYFRAVQFCARFNLVADEKLTILCKKIVHSQMLHELSCERIDEEFKKLLLKSQMPSIGFKVLREFDGFEFFDEFKSINENELISTLNALDRLKSYLYDKSDEKALQLLSVSLVLEFKKLAYVETFLHKLTNNKKFIESVKKLFLAYENGKNCATFSDFELKYFRVEVDFNDLILLLKAKNEIFLAKKLEDRAKYLYILDTPPSPIVKGADLVLLGLKPCKDFKTILKECFDAQLNNEFYNHDQAIDWVKKRLE